MKSSSKKKLIETVLVDKGVITENQLDMAKFESRLKSGVSILEAITSFGFASDVEILGVIADEVGLKSAKVEETLPTFNREILTFPFNLSKSVSESRNQCIYDVNQEEKKVFIAIADPTDPIAHLKTKEYFESLGFSVEFSVVTRLSLSILQKKNYSNDEDYQEKILNYVLKNEDTGEGINRLIELIFEFAALDGASDIYINYAIAENSTTHVFFRVNRKKQFKFAMPKENAKRLVQAIKQRSGMDAGKIRGHQDGSMEVRILQDEYLLSIRVSTITTVSGEQMTLRVQMEDRYPLSELGFKEDHVKKIKSIVKDLKGIIVLSGVTGSGKTTTLYSMLSELDADAYNIITMEDPVEIRIQNINQVQINEDAGQGFAQTIRAVLRQAPDAILLGEIRDAETAARAVEMALTGHLVLTTIHANNVDGIKARLKDLKVENVEAFIKATELAIHQELVPDETKGLRLKYEMALKGLSERYVSE